VGEGFPPRVRPALVFAVLPSSMFRLRLVAAVFDLRQSAAEPLRMKIDGEHKPSAMAPILADRSMMLAGVRPHIEREVAAG